MPTERANFSAAVGDSSVTMAIGRSFSQARAVTVPAASSRGTLPKRMRPLEKLAQPDHRDGRILVFVKTPTALADWLLDRFAGEAWRLDTLVQRLHLAVRTHATAQLGALDSLRLRLVHAVLDRHADALHALDLLERRIEAADPRRALQEFAS